MLKKKKKRHEEKKEKGGKSSFTGNKTGVSSGPKSLQHV